MSLSIRQAKPDEYGAIDQLIEAAYRFDYGERKKHEDPRQLHLAEQRARYFQVWVAHDQSTGELLGSITSAQPGGEHLMEDSTAAEYDFRLLGVSPQARGRGVGIALTEQVIATARSNGYAAVFMKSAPEMVKAHALYFKLGFERDPSRDGLVINGVTRPGLLAFRLALATSAQPQTAQDAALSASYRK